MNRRATSNETRPLRCRELALAALGALLPGEAPGDDAPPEARFLHQAVLRVGTAARGREALDALALAPAPRDALLFRAAAALGLSRIERLAVALVAAVEDDPVVGRVIAWLQLPGTGPRPSLGLLARALAALRAEADDGADPAEAETEALYQLAGGAALCSGLLQLDDEARPLCERIVRIAAPMAAALAGFDTEGPGATMRAPQPATDAAWIETLPELRRAADGWATRLAATPRATLVLRSASAAEARSFAAALATRLGRRPAWFEREAPAGTSAWLAITGCLPVFLLHPAPGEVLALPTLPGHDAPVLAIAGLDGGVRRDESAVADWRIPAPGPAARTALWGAMLEAVPAPGPAAETCGAPPSGSSYAQAALDAARRYRAGYGQIAEHARLVRLLAAGAEAPALPDALARAAIMTSAGRALDALAQALPEAVPDEALVVSEPVRSELLRAVQRCEQREQLHRGLGAAARARACDGVRLLLTGASGTGKSLAAQWLAAQLGLPIYRVDLASMLSKWIGDTEKHLAELLSRAEHADVVLLFDEADTLFGKRTEIATANDRYANAQTNYLLQRIETHAGVVVLTSNSRQRFDPAFVRRLDFIIDFGSPDAQARRALWAAHLGDASDCDATELNRLAALADLAGGHIRNAVLSAAAAARGRGGGAIRFDDIAAGLRGEYRKLGRTPPVEL